MVGGGMTQMIAFATRVMLTSENKHLGWAAAGAVTLLNSSAWLYWLTSARSVFGFRWKDIGAFHAGLYGFGSQGKFKKLFKGQYLDLFAPAKRFASYEQ